VTLPFEKVTELNRTEAIDPLKLKSGGELYIMKSRVILVSLPVYFPVETLVLWLKPQVGEVTLPLEMVSAVTFGKLKLLAAITLVTCGVIVNTPMQSAYFPLYSAGIPVIVNVPPVPGLGFTGSVSVSCAVSDSPLSHFIVPPIAVMPLPDTVAVNVVSAFDGLHVTTPHIIFFYYFIYSIFIQFYMPIQMSSKIIFYNKSQSHFLSIYFPYIV
jgi:hypothetical protein